MREFDQEIAGLKGQVAVISFASPDRLKAFAERLGDPFLWLADPERRSYRHLGLVRGGLGAIAPPRVVWGYVRMLLGGRSWRPEQLDWAQMGGDFVFDGAGNLTLRHISSSSDDRPSTTAIISALRLAARSQNAGADR